MILIIFFLLLLTSYLECITQEIGNCTNVIRNSDSLLELLLNQLLVSSHYKNDNTIISRDSGNGNNNILIAMIAEYGIDYDTILEWSRQFNTTLANTNDNSNNNSNTIITITSALRYCYRNSHSFKIIISILDIITAVQDKLFGKDCLLESIFYRAVMKPIIFEDRALTGGSITSFPYSNDYDSEVGAQLDYLFHSYAYFIHPDWTLLSDDKVREVIIHRVLPHRLPQHIFSIQDTHSGTIIHMPTTLAVTDSSYDTVNGKNLQSRLGHALHLHSLCMKTLHAPLSVFIARAVSAYASDPTSERLNNLGNVLMEVVELLTSGDGDIISSPTPEAEALSEVGYYLSCVSQARLQYQMWSQRNKTLITNDEASLETSHYNAKKDIDDRYDFIIYCYEYGQAWWPGWGPSVVRSWINQSRINSQSEVPKGMGGSEEAVYYTSIELAKAGYRVAIFVELTAEDDGIVVVPTRSGDIRFEASQPRTSADGDSAGSVTWLHVSRYNIHSHCTVFIAWRYPMSLSLGGECDYSFLWLHDIVPWFYMPPSLLARFNGVFVQSNYHKWKIIDGFFGNNHYMYKEVTDNRKDHRDDPTTILETLVEKAAQRTFIVPNGLSFNYPMDGRNHNNIFVYASAPYRGLELVLHEWGRIRSAIPNAILEIYYGFSPTVTKRLRERMGEERFEALRNRIEIGLQQDGVHYYGAVGHDTLTSALSNAGFLLYPSAYQETGCITLLRAMACGAIPITSRYSDSVLNNLTSTRIPDVGIVDMGPEKVLDPVTAKNPELLARWLDEHWTPAVLAAPQSSALALRRQFMKQFIRQRFTWANTAQSIINATLLHSK